MKNFLRAYSETFKEGNILSIMHILYLLFMFSLTTFFRNYVSQNSLHVVVFGSIVFILLAYLIVKNREIILEFCNNCLFRFLNSYMGQKIVWFFWTIEIHLYDNWPAILGFGAILSHMLASFFFTNSPFSMEFSILLFLILFWWVRFRHSFFNPETLNGGFDLSKHTKDGELWSDYILLFNSYLKKRLKKKNYSLIQDRLSGSLGYIEELCKMLVKHPKVARGAGGMALGGSGVYLGLDYRKHSQELKADLKKHSEGLEADLKKHSQELEADLKKHSEQIALERERIFEASREQYRQTKIDILKDNQVFEEKRTLSSEQRLDELEHSWFARKDAIEACKRRTQDARDRLENINTELSELTSDDVIISSKPPSVPSCLEFDLFQFLSL